MAMRQKRRTFVQWYHDLVTRNIIIQQVVRLGLILFSIGFIWFASMALRQAAVNTYFSVSGRGEYIAGHVVDTSISWRISAVEVAYGTKYRETCFVHGHIWAGKNIDRGVKVAMIYEPDNPAVATCVTSESNLVWLYVAGVATLTVGVLVIFLLLFRTNSKVYRRLIGMHTISMPTKRV